MTPSARNPDRNETVRVSVARELEGAMRLEAERRAAARHVERERAQRDREKAERERAVPVWQRWLAAWGGRNREQGRAGVRIVPITGTRGRRAEPERKHTT
jgi:hypothetical protein